jgi:hypothetical protein
MRVAHLIAEQGHSSKNDDKTAAAQAQVKISAQAGTIMSMRQFYRHDRQPNPVPSRPPLVLPPNFRDVTAERVGTVVAIVGAMAAPKGEPK